ncbi:MAG TPA: hypothetical protein VMM59_02140 [Thermohalobaculum sp.]|nr:hypothetical protein [Thermohalobaculum sp.]
MKAFLAAVVAMAVLAVGADLALDRMGFSSSEVYSKPSVRLGE